MKKNFSHIESLVSQACDELNCRLYLLEWNSVGLQVYVDKTDALISVAECEAVSKRIHLFLSEINLSHQLRLEVSSPGVERKLKYPWHFSEVIGKNISIVTFESIEGQKSFIGCLTQATEKEIFIENPERMLKIPFRNIQKAHVVFNFKKEKNKDLVI